MPMAMRALVEPHLFTAPVPPLCRSRPVTPRTTALRSAHVRSKLLHCAGVVEVSVKKPRLNREGLSLVGRGYRKSGRGQPSTFHLLRGLPIDVTTIDLSGDSAPPVEVEAETPAEAEEVAEEAEEAETPAFEVETEEAEDLRAVAMEMASVLAQINSGASPFVPTGPLAPVQAPSGPLATIEDVSDECGSDWGSEVDELPCSSTWLPCAIAQPRSRPKLSSLKVDVQMSREPSSKTHTSPLVARADAVVALGRTLLAPLDVHLPSVPVLTEMRASRRSSYDALKRTRREARESASHRASLLKRLQVTGLS